MHPTLVAQPFYRAGWFYEEKVDGWRMVAIKTEGAVRLVSRSGRDLTRRFPELVATVGALGPPSLILDGEVAVFDTTLVSRLEWLHGRPEGETATPTLYMAFDCLYLRGKDLRERPLRVRRHVLEGEVDGRRLILPARRLADEGLTAWSEALGRDYERLVAKDPASPYVGGRTLKWLKVKQREYRIEERGWDPRNGNPHARRAGVRSTRWPSRPVPPRTIQPARGPY